MCPIDCERSMDGPWELYLEVSVIWYLPISELNVSPAILYPLPLLKPYMSTPSEVYESFQ